MDVLVQHILYAMSHMKNYINSWQLITNISLRVKVSGLW